MKNLNPAGIDGVSRDLQTTPIRVLVVDDHPAVVDALTVLVDAQPDMAVCAGAYTVEEALSHAAGDRPDVVVTDVLLGDGHGLDLIGRLHARYPEVRLIAFSMCQEAAFAERAIRAGALGYVMKTQATTAVVEAIRAVWRGEVCVSRQIASRMLNKLIEREQHGHCFPLESLTDHELLVFEMLGHEYSLREVARCLGISRKTAAAYQRHAQKKLGAANPARLVQQAYRWVNGIQPLFWMDHDAVPSAPHVLPQRERQRAAVQYRA